MGSGRKQTLYADGEVRPLLWRHIFTATMSTRAGSVCTWAAQHGGPWNRKVRSSSEGFVEPLTTRCSCSVLVESHSGAGGCLLWCYASHDDGSECNANSGCRASGTYGFGVEEKARRTRGGIVLLQPVVLAIVTIVSSLRAASTPAPQLLFTVNHD